MFNQKNKLTNLEYLEVTCNNDIVMIKKIINIFLISTPKIISDLQIQLLKGDWQSITAGAHKLKSSFLMMGAKNTGEKLETIELLAKEKLHLKIQILLDEIEYQCTQIYAELGREY